MSAATLAADQAPSSPSGRLLALVRALFDYGIHLAVTLRVRAIATDTTDLTRRFGTISLPLILARITLALHRARLLEEKILRTVSRLDAVPHAKSAPPLRAPRASSSQAEPRVPALAQPQPTDTEALLASLPTVDQLAARIRSQPIGSVLADICRDLGITRGHPLWSELHAAITMYGGNPVRLFMDWLNRAYPIAHIMARLKAERAVPRPPAQVRDPPPHCMIPTA
jgi:hypothetical protein